MKKLISVLSASIFIMTSAAIIMPYSIYAERYKVTDEDGSTAMSIDYTVVDDHAEISAINLHDVENIVVPAEIDGYPVKVIRKTSLNGLKEKVKSIYFEDGIEEINLYCGGYKKLTELHLPDTLKSGDFSFDNCNALKEITIPGSLEEIPDFCFDSCDRLERITIEDGVKVIGKYAFTGTPVSDITIPSSVYNIDDYAFDACENLKTITLSKSLEYIGDFAFYKTGLEEISLPNGLKEIGEQAFGYTQLKEIKLPDTLEAIGYEAFKGCKSLTKAYIPKGIMNKPNKAWYNCPALTDVTLGGEMTKELYDHLTADTPWGKKYASAISDDFVIFGGNYLSKYQGKDKNPVIPDNITAMSEKAFQNANIDTVTFSPNIKEIPKNCFMGSTIKELTVPSTIKTIGEMAFMNCKNLEKITIEDGVESVASKAFMNCYSILEENVSMGKSVKVASDAFKQTPMDKEYIASGQWNPDFATPSPTKVPTETDIPQETTAPQTTEAPSENTSNEKLTVQSGDGISISVDGNAVLFPDAQPFVDENGRTQVPIRAVSEMLDCTVDWNGETQTATVTHKNGDTIALTLGSDVMTINGKTTQMDTAAMIKDDRTYIPVRFVAEALGLSVEWEE